VLDCWLSRARDLAAAEAFFRRTLSSTGCLPEHVVTDKAAFYPSAIRTCAPDARHTATGFYNPVISTNRCERNHGYVKARIRPMRGLRVSTAPLDGSPLWVHCNWLSANSCGCGRLEDHALEGAAMFADATSPESLLGWVGPCRARDNHQVDKTTSADALDPTTMSKNLPHGCPKPCRPTFAP
jgi:hypothetical protein